MGENHFPLKIIFLFALAPVPVPAMGMVFAPAPLPSLREMDMSCYLRVRRENQLT